MDDGGKLVRELRDATTIAQFVRVLLDEHIDFRFEIGEYPRPHEWHDITDYLLVREVLKSVPA
jgi:hypothetical protein